MVTENCKKIEPIVVKLCSKTKYTIFSEHDVYQFSNQWIDCHNTSSSVLPDWNTSIYFLTICSLVFSPEMNLGWRLTSYVPNRSATVITPSPVLSILLKAWSIISSLACDNGPCMSSQKSNLINYSSQQHEPGIDKAGSRPCQFCLGPAWSGPRHVKCECLSFTDEDNKQRLAWRRYLNISNWPLTFHDACCFLSYSWKKSLQK